MGRSPLRTLLRTSLGVLTLAGVVGAVANARAVGAAATPRASGAATPRAAGATPHGAIAERDLFPLHLDERTWLGVELMGNERVRLPGAVALPLLGRFEHPERRTSAPFARFWAGRYGPGQGVDGLGPGRLAWNTLSCEPLAAASSLPFVPAASPLAAFDVAGLGAPWGGAELAPMPAWLAGGATPAPELFPIARDAECPAWQRPKPGVFFRQGLERDTFALLECDGSIAPEALDRLSAMARPLETPAPPLPLPAEPSPEAGPGEWLPGLRLVHPRLVWVMQQVANRFPYRAIYVVSGHRPGSRGSQHSLGRALDISVVGASKERVFAFCRELADVACGYYPHHDFVHFDVRENGTGHPAWVDVSHPGETSEYVATWPGVLEASALESDGLASGGLASGGLEAIGEF